MISSFLKMVVTFHIALLPFTAVKGISAFGEFSKNLSLYTALILILSLLLQTKGAFWKFRGINKPTRIFNISFFLFFAWSILSTTIMTMHFSMEGIKNVYNIDFYSHTITRGSIPIVLWLIYFSTYYFTVKYKLGWRIVKTLTFSIIFLFAYGLAQQLYIFGLLPNLEPIAKLIESGRDLSVPIMALDSRTNLTLYEPAEAARFLLMAGIPVVYWVGKTSLKQNYSYSLFFILLLLLLLTRASSAYLTLVVMLVVYFLINGGKRVKLVAICGGVILIACPVVVIFAPGIVEQLNYILFDKIASIENSESSQTRYAFIVASGLIMLDYPLFGIGWSRDVFVIGDYFPHWGLNWETIKAFDSGVAISARSFLFRIGAYSGFPGVLLYLFTFTAYIRFIYLRRKNNKNKWLLATILFCFAFLILNIVDGGIITNIYQWAILGFVVGHTDVGLSNSRAKTSIN